MASEQVLIVLCSLVLGTLGQLNPNPFPADFMFGVATSAYQTEGAWDVNGKGENIWDRLVHTRPEQVADGTNGDVACDSYNHLDEDIALIANLGVQFYRFSISWSRILPTGTDNEVNLDGIRYYNEIIDQLLAKGIEPFVTLYHWDLPQPLQDLGGWTSDSMIGYFEDYARVAFENFGDRVKYWLTFNAPVATCFNGYNGVFAPAINSDGVGTYLCSHVLLKSHARVYHLYNNIYKPTQNGKVSIALESRWAEPNSTLIVDVDAADRQLQFNLGWFGNPIFSTLGDYPRIMKDYVGRRSLAEGFSESRLPVFTEEEVNYIKGTYDFFGLNHYTSYYVANKERDPIGDPGYEKDIQVTIWQDPSWAGSASDWLKVVPWGFTKLLTWIKENYNNPDIYVVEGGFSDLGDMNDTARIDYYELYLSALLDAVYDQNVAVKSYAAFGLLDNWEWLDGFTKKLGLHHVDFSDPARPRTPKASATTYKDIITNWQLPASKVRKNL